MEKNHQVAIMREIYANASPVLVWLAEPDDNLDQITAKLDPDDKLDQFMANLNHGEREAEQWRQVVDKLLQRPWWSRMWVVQEVVAAKECRFSFVGKTRLHG